MVTKSAAILLLIAVQEMGSTEALISVGFEVYGRVQGVFFRKHTEQQAKKLALRGWCRNTSDGTVKGVIEGTTTRISEMKTWLKTTGSPESRIERAEFGDERPISKYTFQDFSIKR